MKSGHQSKRSIVLGEWGRWASTNYRATLLIALCLTVVLGLGMVFLELNLSFYSILPTGSRQVRDLKLIEEQLPAATSIVVVLDASESSVDPAGTQYSTESTLDMERRVTSAADAVASDLQGAAYKDEVARVIGRLPLDFYRDHGLLLMEEKDLERMAQTFSRLDLVSIFEGINSDFESVYIADESRAAADETELVGQIEGIGSLLRLITETLEGATVTDEDVSGAVDRFLFGDQYILSSDRTKALVFVQPKFGMDDAGTYVRFIPEMEKAVKSRAAEFGVAAGLTGLIVVAKDEFVTSEQGLALSMTVALILILVLLVVSFRMFAVPFIVGIPLLTGVLWTIGLTGYIIHRLNIMTAMYMVALIGLGVDYAIHIITTYVQEHEEGVVFHDAVAAAMRKSGAGILTGAVTTAIAFFALVVADSSMVKELGVVAGLGILSEFAAMFVLVPALLGLREKRRVRRGKLDEGVLGCIHVRWRIMDWLGTGIQGRPLAFVLVALAVGIALSTQAPCVEVEGNLMNMEAKGLKSIELQDTMIEEFGMASDTLSVLAASLEEARELSRGIDDLTTVDHVESLSLFIPSETEQKKRLVGIAGFRDIVMSAPDAGATSLIELSDEIARLQMNLLELSSIAYMGDLPNLLDALTRITGWGIDGQKTSTTQMDILLASDATGSLAGLGNTVSSLVKDRLLQLTSTGPISEEDLPKLYLDSFRSADGEHYLVNVIPTGNPWGVDFRKALTSQLKTVTDRATGMVLAADQMTQIAQTDGLRAALVALTAILVVLLIDFRNLRLAVLALLPLLLSMGSLFGIMAIVGIKFDFINIIAVPLLIGIGIDDAVHVNHRYMVEGPGSIARVVSRTGRAILLTSLTTIIGFASFIPAIMRAMRSTGIVLSIAMALAFLFSLTFHPAMLSLVFERKNRRNS